MGLTENLGNNLSAIYNVRETELSQGRSQETQLKQSKQCSSTKKPPKEVQCIVNLLDNTSQTFEIDVSSIAL